MFRGAGYDIPGSTVNIMIQLELVMEPFGEQVLLMQRLYSPPFGERFITGVCSRPVSAAQTSAGQQLLASAQRELTAIAACL